VFFGGGEFGFIPSICDSDHHRHAKLIFASTVLSTEGGFAAFCAQASIVAQQHNKPAVACNK
jgi:hypothetical protein